MRRSSSRSLASGIVFVVFLATLGAILGALQNAVRTLTPAVVTAGAVLVAAIIAIVLIWERHQRTEREKQKQQALIEVQKNRKAYLLEKYGNEAVVNEIIGGYIWHDMTKEQLLDSWGPPADTETKVLKSKIREVYKYDRRGVNRFARRAVLENDVVVGWEIK